MKLYQKEVSRCGKKCVVCGNDYATYEIGAIESPPAAVWIHWACMTEEQKEAWNKHTRPLKAPGESEG
jgi:hypothetical protein